MRMNHRLLFLQALLLFLILAGSGVSSAGGDFPVEFGGSVRALGVIMDNTSCNTCLENDYEELAQGVLRLWAAGRNTEGWNFEIHLVESGTYYTAGGTASSGLLRLTAPKSRYRALDDTWAHTQEEDFSGSLWLDRAAVMIYGEHADITLGRQAITFGTAYFWNPMDVFLAFDATQFDRDYKPGVDAVRADIPVGMLSEVNLVYSPGRELGRDGGYVSERWADASWYGSALLAHARFHHSGWDFTGLAGKVYGGCRFGAGATGETGPLALRFEAAAFVDAGSAETVPPPGPDLYEDYVEAVIGAGHRWTNSLDLEFEYLFNGAGSRRGDYQTAWLRYRQGAILHLGRHLLGGTASYEFTPLLNGRFLAIYSLTDRSAQLQSFLSYSLSNNAELLAGAAFNFGERPSLGMGGIEIRSEFGLFPHFYFLEIKQYF